MAPIEPNPWYQVPNQPKLPLGHIYRQRLHCNRHLYAPIGARCLRDMFQWGQYHARQRLFPRTKFKGKLNLSIELIIQKSMAILNFCANIKINFMPCTMSYNLKKQASYQSKIRTISFN